MSNPITISPEVTRLAQSRASVVGRGLPAEMARLVAEAAIIELDPEYDFIVAPNQAHSAKDPLVKLLDLNDIVVNEQHIDIRVSDEDGRVTMNQLWVGTTYLANGSLAVRLDTASTGRIVGWISGLQWSAAGSEGAEGKVIAKCPEGNFDLAEALKKILDEAEKGPPGGRRHSKVSDKELTQFAHNPAQILLARQREIVDEILVDEQLQSRYVESGSVWSNAAIGDILHASSIWNARINHIVEAAGGRFPHLQPAEIRALASRIGEAYGGQPDSPMYRKALLAALSREELTRRSPGLKPASVAHLWNEVFSGKQAADAVGELVKNKAVVELAVSIKRQRDKAKAFISATADEISAAFQQLALQPAYATHSVDKQTGVEEINKALTLLDAAEMIDQVRLWEEELG